MKFIKQCSLLACLIVAVQGVTAAEKDASESVPAPAAASAPVAAPAAPPQAAEQPASPKMTQEEFVKLRAFAVKDTGRKVKLLSAAKTCFAAAKNQEAFMACNKTLQDGVRAHMAEQLAEANK